MFRQRSQQLKNNNYSCCSVRVLFTKPAPKQSVRTSAVTPLLVKMAALAERYVMLAKGDTTAHVQQALRGTDVNFCSEHAKTSRCSKTWQSMESTQFWTETTIHFQSTAALVLRRVSCGLWSNHTLWKTRIRLRPKHSTRTTWNGAISSSLFIWPRLFKGWITLSTG